MSLTATQIELAGARKARLARIASKAFTSPIIVVAPPAPKVEEPAPVDHWTEQFRQAWEMLDSLSNQRARVKRIQSECARHYGISLHDMLSECRTCNLVLPRHVAMFLVKKRTPLSLPAIGRLFSNRDHTTILNAVRKIERLTERNPEIAADIETIQMALR